MQKSEKKFNDCSLDNDEAIPVWQPLTALAKALMKLVTSAKKMRRARN
ncbi:MAG: hypothetical protein WKF59_19705 [Chitinophagaceae bacterium]